MKFKVIQSFAAVGLGSFSGGEIVELTTEQASGLVEAGLLAVLPKSQDIETAELKVEPETADLKPVRRKK